MIRSLKVNSPKFFPKLHTYVKTSNTRIFVHTNCTSHTYNNSNLLITSLSMQKEHSWTRYMRTNTESRVSHTLRGGDVFDRRAGVVGVCHEGQRRLGAHNHACRLAHSGFPNPPTPPKTPRISKSSTHQYRSRGWIKINKFVNQDTPESWGILSKSLPPDLRVVCIVCRRQVLTPQARPLQSKKSISNYFRVPTRGARVRNCASGVDPIRERVDREAV